MPNLRRKARKKRQNKIIFTRGQDRSHLGKACPFSMPNFERGNLMTEYITNIPLEKLKPFPNHPFQVRDDDSMRETVESIKTYGVLQPAIVRPSDDGSYEILSGHRRKHACELAGKK